MKDWFLNLSLLLTYGPFVVMFLLYLMAWLLRDADRPGLVEWLTKATETPPTVRRKMKDQDPDTGASAYS